MHVEGKPGIVKGDGYGNAGIIVAFLFIEDVEFEIVLLLMLGSVDLGGVAEKGGGVGLGGGVIVVGVLESVTEDIDVDGGSGEGFDSEVEYVVVEVSLVMDCEDDLVVVVESSVVPQSPVLPQFTVVTVLSVAIKTGDKLLRWKVWRCLRRFTN
ncbi:hypothetical protein HDU76_007689 [Blyttiomyces sp. JEL0837]|nr:hypothetical protein HDU76_007689 [Blyttiomyces sp. JEL0837]